MICQIWGVYTSNALFITTTHQKKTLENYFVKNKMTQHVPTFRFVLKTPSFGPKVR